MTRQLAHEIGKKHSATERRRPADVLEVAGVFVWPPRPGAILIWLFGSHGYLLPWNALYFAIALICWFLFTPEMSAMKDIKLGWISLILLRNLGLTIIVFGAWHLYFYILKRQKADFKFNEKQPPTNSKSFLFRHQVWDNIFWTVVSAVPIWTGYEVVMLWAYANDVIPFMSWSSHPVFFAAQLALIPFIRDIHFYVVHRLLHWRPLYRRIHKLHHHNVNPCPWSGLAMHPIEHLFYFSGVLLHWFVASHPVHILFHLQHAALSPAQGHCGFDRISISDGMSISTDNYFHYLHHKYFECNYGGDGFPAFDMLFGTFNDGTKAAKGRLEKRLTNE